MDDGVDFHERYGECETDCYSSACEDDESIGSDDEGSSDSGLKPYVPEHTTPDLGESSVDGLEYHSSPIPGDKHEVDKSEGPLDECPDDGFKGFDETEIKDNRVFYLFEKFREIKCFCIDKIKEEDGARERIIPRQRYQHEEIKDEEDDTQNARRDICITDPRVRKAKKKAESFIQSLKEVYGVGQQGIGSDDHDYDEDGVGREEDNDDDNYGDEDGRHCTVDLTPGDIDYGSEKQKEVNYEKHYRSELWYCDKCGFRTNYKRVLNQHHWSHKLDKECFKCSICSLKFNDIVRLHSHVAKEHEDRGKTARQESSLFPKAHSESSCSVCGLKFKNTSSLQAHVRKKHPNPKRYSYNCALCNHSTNNKPNHRNHMMKHKPSIYDCAQCDYSTNNCATYRTHMMTHTGQKPYACPHCPYRARQHPHLKQHLLFHMNLKPYECNICHFKTRQKSHLTKHLLWVHTDDKPFKCSLCEFAAKSKKTRDVHYQSQHTNNKPYACKLCPFKSAHVNILVDHRKMHGADLDYSCSECTWSGRTSLSLSLHVTGCHPGSKCIKNCQECDYRTTDNTSLENHLKIKHGVSLLKNPLIVQLPLKN